MQEITATDFERVRPLFDPIQFCRSAVFTVIEGSQPGRIFVDRPDRPAAALMVSDSCYFSGSPGAVDLQSEVVDLLAREAMPRRDYLLLFPLTPAWHTAIESAFQAYQTKWYERCTFELDALRYRELHSGWRQRIPAGFSLRRITAETAIEVGGIDEMWGSVENFLAKGFGFCLVDESMPDAHSGFAGSVQTVFVGDRHAETGVGIREAYRRKGLATAACCAYLDHCLDTGVIPDWGCVLNEASEKLAYKMGFGNKRSWPFLFVATPEALKGK